MLNSNLTSWLGNGHSTNGKVAADIVWQLAAAGVKMTAIG